MTENTLSLVRSGFRTLGCISPNAAGYLALRLFTSPKRYKRPKWELEIMESGEAFFLRSGLAAHRWGTKNKPTVLLVHGWEGRGTQLARLVEPLVKIGYRVVAIDGPAHGDSPGKRTNIRMYSEALRDASEELSETGQVEAVVAHSFGAGATVIALKKGMNLPKVVLVASPSDLNWVIDDYCRMIGLKGKSEDAFRKHLKDWTGFSPEDVNIASLAPKISTPALVIHDLKDFVVPFSHAERLVEGWTNARLVTLSGAGHRRILKSPKFIDATVDFIDQRKELN